VSRYGTQLKVPITKARVRVVMRWYRHGSVLAQTIESGCTGVETHLEIESPAPPEKVAAVIRCAKRGCYAENLVAKPVPLTSAIVVNGAAFDLAAYPAPAAR
jgi:hypothetical protein